MWEGWTNVWFMVEWIVGVKQEAGKIASSRAYSLRYSLEEITYTVPTAAWSKPVLWLQDLDCGIPAYL